MSAIAEKDSTPLSDKENMDNSKRKRNTVTYKDADDDDEEDNKKVSKKVTSKKKRKDDDEEEDNNNNDDESKQKKKTSKKKKIGDDDDEDDFDEWAISQTQSQYDDTEDFAEDEIKRDYEAGQILQIDVENFMCHRRMTVKLGRHVNFITGQNGSGKSAIAAAIQLVCGANTKDTGRGKSLGSLIREGSDGPAILKVRLLNEGVDEYRRSDYGSRITIERTIEKSGSSSYLLKNGETDNIVSKEKKELQKILQHFNIYPDNPMNVLTQEDSKKFIQGKEDEKYQFFLRASGLEKVKEELTEVKAQIDEARSNLKTIEDRLDIKKQSKNKLKSELEQFQKLGDIRKKIELANAKLLWFPYFKALKTRNVWDKELSKFEKEYNELLEKLRLLEAATNENENAEELKQRVSAIHEEKDSIENDIAKKSAEISSKQKAISNINKQITDCKNKIGEFNDNKKRVRKEIDDMRKKAASSAKGDEKKIHDDSARASRELDELKQRLTELKEEKQRALDEKEDLSEQYKEAKNGTKWKSDQIKKKEADLKALKEASKKGNAQSKYADLARFDPNFPSLLEEIDKTKFIYPPVGPIGAFVKFKRDKFAKAIEIFSLGSMLRTFIVRNLDDQRKLSGILKKFGLGNKITIRVDKRDTTDRFENLKIPKHPGVETVLDELIITNDLVYNALIDQAYIESTILYDNTDYVDQFLLNGRGFKENIKSLITNKPEKLSYTNGNRYVDSAIGRFSRNLIKVEGAAVVNDNADLINEKQAEINDAKNELNDLVESEKSLRDALQQCSNKIDNIDRSITTINNDIRALSKNKADLDSKLHEIEQANALDTSYLEKEDEEYTEGISALQSQLTDYQKDLEQCNKELQSKQSEKKSLDKKIVSCKEDLSNLENEISNIRQSISEAERLRKNTERDAEKKEKEVSKIKESIMKEDEKIEKLKSECEAGTLILLKTEEDGGDWDGLPIESNESAETLTRSIEKWKKEEDAEKKKHGLLGRTEAEVQERYTKALEDFKASKSEYSALSTRLVDMDADFKERKETWRSGMKLNALKVRRRFDHYLNCKGFSGTAKFEHKEQTLRLITRTDNTDRNSTCHDVRQLSGGERSYTTLCLLFALGHVSECPFRLMDEYDVFMDEASRKLTLKLLTEYALKPEQRGRQFIIITPNNLSHVKTDSSNVKIIQMQAPDRRERAASGPKQRTLEETF